jgi:dienelactone hydrolase
MIQHSLPILIGLACFSFAQAEIKTKDLKYADGEVVLEGFLAWNETATTGVANPSARTAPGILVVHQWMGLTDYEKRRCEQLAKMGYVAFALDIYGANIHPTNQQEAGQEAGKYKNDRDLFRRRLQRGLEQLRSQPDVDPNRIAAIGYCFGGTGVLELVRSGAEINGVVSFHGGLDSPSPNDGKNITAKILICHGADDPFVPQEDIAAFKKELNDARVDWQMNYYSGSVHSFTQPMAGDDNTKGAAYNETADRRSWAAMQLFFDELFGD